MIRNLDKRLNIFVDNLKTKLKSDIYGLQAIFREDLFVYSTQLFKIKWLAKNSESIDEFIDYFFTKWIDKNNEWYEGFVDGICYPSKSNGLESSHDKIKDTINRKRV